MKGYTDLDQYNPPINEDDLKILQNLDIQLPANQKKNTVIVQNISINKENRDFDFDSIIILIRRYGGVQGFIKAIYAYAIQQNKGNLARAADDLMIPRQTLSEYRKKYLLSYEDD